MAVAARLFGDGAAAEILVRGSDEMGLQGGGGEQMKDGREASIAAADAIDDCVDDDNDGGGGESSVTVRWRRSWRFGSTKWVCRDEEESPWFSGKSSRGENNSCSRLASRGRARFVHRHVKSKKERNLYLIGARHCENGACHLQP
ncbi:hypothetical protein Scep_024686 [Stephania cephalantha]|uniref:Uncharacterized protein n=1 Tax=Stephania cephalantha TaxID=152367 RepID=A0AAP0EX13_9MAGN